jgi:hypothetical protein
MEPIVNIVNDVYITIPAYYYQSETSYIGVKSDRYGSPLVTALILKNFIRDKTSMITNFIIDRNAGILDKS